MSHLMCPRLNLSSDAEGIEVTLVREWGTLRESVYPWKQQDGNEVGDRMKDHGWPLMRPLQHQLL